MRVWDERLPTGSPNNANVTCVPEAVNRHRLKIVKHKAHAGENTHLCSNKLRILCRLLQIKTNYCGVLGSKRDSCDKDRGDERQKPVRQDKLI